MLTKLYRKSGELVILFDIDGTLIDGFNFWAGLFKLTLDDLYATNLNIDQIEIAGKTDAFIIGKLNQLYQAELEVDSIDDVIVKREYLRNLNDKELASKFDLLPCAEEVLDELRRSGIAMGLVTGNYKAAAIAKLTAKGISKYFDYTISSFAEDGGSRVELLERSIGLLEKKTPFAMVAYVGDTVNDVASANKLGLISVSIGDSYLRAKKDSPRDMAAIQLEGWHQHVKFFEKLDAEFENRS